MKYFTLLFILFSASGYSQCDNLTNVQYYDNTYSNFSKKYQVSVKFGKSHEISNGYNYVDSDGNGESIYCVITGFEEPYLVKLFTTFNSGYETNCSSIFAIFNDGYVQGKDSEGRIWKIYKPNTNFYNTNSNNSTQRKYNKVTSNINIDGISKGLSTMQNRIDNNRSTLSQLIDNINRRRDILYYKIDKLNNPAILEKMRRTINANIESCAKNIDTGSNRATSSVVSCMNRQFTQLDILEMEINNFSITGNSKNFNVVRTTKKDVSYSDVKNVINKEGKTFVEIEYVSPYQSEGWISIAKETYLYDVTNKLNLKLIGVRNITVSPERKSVSYNTKTTFELVFEQLPSNSKKISIIECEKDSCFNFYGIVIY